MVNRNSIHTAHPLQRDMAKLAPGAEALLTSVSIRKCLPDKGFGIYLTQFDNYFEMFIYKT